MCAHSSAARCQVSASGGAQRRRLEAVPKRRRRQLHAPVSLISIAARELFVVFMQNAPPSDGNDGDDI